MMPTSAFSSRRLLLGQQRGEHLLVTFSLADVTPNHDAVMTLVDHRDSIR